MSLDQLDPVYLQKHPKTMQGFRAGASQHRVLLHVKGLGIERKVATMPVPKNTVVCALHSGMQGHFVVKGGCVIEVSV